MNKRELLFQIESTREFLEFALREHDHELQVRLQRALIELHDNLYRMEYASEISTQVEAETLDEKKGA
ncbi:MAG: hypothetical protein V4485_06280 [Pseudomonadota bacterium]